MEKWPQNDNSREFGRVLKEISAILTWAEMDRREKFLVLAVAHAATGRLHDKLETYGYD